MLLKHASTYQYHAISKYVVQEPTANIIALSFGIWSEVWFLFLNESEIKQEEMVTGL